MQKNTKQKGLIGLAVMLVLAIAVIFGSDPLYRMLDSKNAANPAPGTSSVKLNDGKYEAQEADFDSMGYKGIVTMEVSSGAITSLVWDCIDKEGNLKSVLSVEGKYVMTENGPTWNDQAIALAEYVIANQSVAGITMGEDGKTDTVASVSIDVSGFVNLVTECMNQARGITKPVSDLKDGSYHAEEQEFDSAGYKGMVTLEVVSGYIAKVDWDCVDKDGNKKSQLSMDGKYIMTESNPRWHEQAAALAEFVIANQSASGLAMGDDGKTDTLTSVSIDISGFVNLVNECLEQAR